LVTVGGTHTKVAWLINASSVAVGVRFKTWSTCAQFVNKSVYYNCITSICSTCVNCIVSVICEDGGSIFEGD